MPVLKRFPIGSQHIGRYSHALAELRSWFKSGNFEIGRATGACLVLGLTYVLAFSMYWLASDAMTTMQMKYDAKQNLLGVLQKRSSDMAPNGSSIRRDLFLAAATETLAAADLDDKLRQITAEENGIVLSSHAEANHDTLGPGNKIEIKAILEGKIETIQSVLFRLETGMPMIFIDALDIEPKNQGLRNAIEPAPMLHAALTLVAFWRGPTSQPQR
jgi:general secretion pathway protein M